MMNDALMQKKSRHTNTQRYLTDYVRRALLFLALVVASVGSAWGQISSFSKGVIDENNVADYTIIKYNYTENESNRIPDISTQWSGYNGQNGSGQHWKDGSSTYFDCWNGTALITSQNYKTTTITLPKGRYVLLAPARAGATATVTMKINDDAQTPHESSISMSSTGNSGKGITTTGEASFDAGTFANNGEGRGWRYFYIRFNVDNDGTSVTITVSGESTGEGWISCSTPYLLKVANNTPSTDVPTETDLTTGIFHQWDSPNANANITNQSPGCSDDMGTSSGLPYGDGNVYYLNYADLTNYNSLVLNVTSGTPRLVFNRAVPDGNDTNGGAYLEINSSSSPYVTVNDNKWIINLDMVASNYGYAHLNCIKGQGGNVTIASATLTGPSLRSLYHVWSGSAAGSTVTTENPTGFVWKAGEEVAAGGVIYGDGSGAVPPEKYADLSQYDNLVLTYDNTKALPRFLFNMAEGNAFVEVNSEGDYMTLDGNKIIIHLAKLASDNGGYAHLNSIKAPWGGSSTIYNATLENVEKPVTIEKTIAVGSDNMIKLDGNLLCDHIPYNYIRIELVDGNNANKVIYAEGTTNIPNDAATFKVETPLGDYQQHYANVGNKVYSYALLDAGAYDGQVVSFSDFTFKLPNRYNYPGNHLKIYLSRFSDDTYGENNPPEIEKIYDYTIWAAGNDAGAAEHILYAENDHASNFDVELYTLLHNGQDLLDLYSDKNALTDFNDFYIRWYVADKTTHLPIADANGNPISMKTQVNGKDLLRPYNNGSFVYPKFWHEDVGYFVWLDDSGPDQFSTDDGAKLALNVSVSLPNGLTQDDVEMVALVIDNLEGGGPNMEPLNLQHKYIIQFTNIEELQYKNLPFRHYKGVTGRDWVKPKGSIGTMTQAIWTAAESYNNLLPTVEEEGQYHNSPLDGSAAMETVDVRQGVHTWEYNVYVTPSDGRRALVLPFENYMYDYQTGIAGDGNDLEPRAYFRWYDWKTDRAVANPEFTMTACNPNILKPYTETVGNETRDRGLVALNLDPDHPTQGRIGVWFEVGENFTEANYPNGLDIACDVSKYSDGIRVFGTNAYLEHEPTLSMRYIFHIHPASVIADTLKAAKENLGKARQLLENTSLTPAERLALYTNLEYYGIHHDGQDIEPMFNFPENRGRIVVSLGTGKKGNFSLRLDERSLDNYKLWDVNNEGQLVNADHVKWVAFYENEETGEVMRKQLVEPSTSFIQSFTYADFQGYFYPLGSTEASQHIENGMRFHVVGYVTSGEVNTLAGTGNFAPVAHYEVQFLVAPPLKVTDLRDNTDNVRIDNITRTDEYLAQNYDLKTVVDFDGNPETNENLIKYPERKHSFYSSLDASPIPYTQLQDNKSWSDYPTYAANNMSWMPRQWGDIEYSYCYPQLCPYVINTNPNNSYWQYNHFLSPNHGDYMILKTMNLPGISTQRTEPYLLQFWDGTELHDYTYVYNHNGSKGSGSFLYTDASNESRTMITIPFEADLCGGSSIYFTAAVADMTDATIKPQLLVRVVGIGENGERVRVVSFHTCEIFTAADDPHSGQWYQVYGESTIPANFDDGIVDFVCEVVNYADNTNGADFAIDHFQLYTNTAKVKLSQDQGDCDDPASNKMFIYADAEGIQALYGKTGTTKIYWRIHDEHGEVVTAPRMYNDSDTEGTGIYGEIEIPLDYTKNNAVHTEAEVKANDNLYWFMGDDHKVYCKIAYRYMPGLMDGQTYYVSVYDPARQRSEVGFRPENNAYWGGLNTAARSKCSVFSPFFIPRQQFVIYYKEGVDGQAEGGHITMSCHGEPVVTDMKMMLKKPDIEQPSGFTNITDKIHFDYFFGTIQQWNSTNAAETFTYNNVQYTYKDVKEAWNEYRVSDSFYSAVGPTVRTDFNETLTSGQDARTVLQAAVDAGLLALDYSYNFSNNFNTRPAKNYTVVCLPIEDKIPGTNPAVSICSPFVVKFDIVWPSPEMELGFADVEYPQREGMHRVVRIGLEQLNNLRNNGYKLHVPVHDYKNKLKNVNVGTLYFQSDMLTVSAVSNEQQEVAATNDPIGPAVGANFAKLLTPNGSSTHGNTPFVDADHMFLVLDLSGDNCQINFHEGYSYEVSTSFFDQADAIEDACFEDLYLTIKVVPEFVTWDPQKLGTQTTEGIDYYNVNWNNDNNWNRSERDELYKGAVTDAATASNHATGAHPNGYKNDTEIDSRLSSSNAFVPMKFTYVTLPEACRAPSLINMELQAYNTSPYTGGALLAGNLITDPSPYDPARVVNSPATQDIVYDILVRYSETECQGHLKNDKSSVYYLRHDNKVYDCEKFYGNICKEIYFKPRAELINQQRLTYERAWVEKELVPNQWYLMSAPLKATYAGDMYVPKADGRQTTEAFQPITFNTTNYSRTTYPFYQHSWDHGTGVNGSTVYKESSNYTADLPYTGAVTSTFAQWSHAFNDVQVPYSEMQGFAIHTKQAGSGSGNALLRLPKADTSWNYYNYKDEQGSLNQGVTKGNLKYGRFLTDGDDGKPINNNAQMTKSLVQPNVNASNRYYLVGNPYMASLDMAKFFEANTHLENKWWTIDGNPSAGVATGRARPMEAFFVKTTSPATKVSFNKDMMVDGNDGTDQTSSGSRRYVQLKAGKGGVTSTARIELNEEATSDYQENEDVETLFDSNLADVPMVYTVAGGQAVSINQLPELDVVPFGVTCTGNEAVLCTIHPSPFTLHPSPLYVFDALLGTTTAIGDGDTFSVQPNDYGRYYLTTNAAIGSTVSKKSEGIVVSVRNGQVTVKADEPIKRLRVISLSGATVAEKTYCGTNVTFLLSEGSYAIEAESEAGRRTVKILVR